MFLRACSVTCSLMAMPTPEIFLALCFSSQGFLPFSIGGCLRQPILPIHLQSVFSLDAWAASVKRYAGPSCIGGLSRSPLSVGLARNPLVSPL